MTPKHMQHVIKSADMARMALIMLADGDHNFDSPEFKSKFTTAVKHLRAFGQALFESDEDVLAAIKEIHTKAEKDKRINLSISFEQDKYIYVQYNELAAAHAHAGSSSKLNIAKHVCLDGINVKHRRVNLMRSLN